MNATTKWLSALVALVLVLTALPLAAFAQSSPGQGNPPPGQAKDKGRAADGGDGRLIVQQLSQMAGQASAQAPDHRQINVRAERLLGLPILNREGKRIGEVGDVLVSIVGQRQSGNPDKPAAGGLVGSARVDYVLARFGGSLGFGGENAQVPLAALRLHLVDGQGLGFDHDLVYFEGTEPGDGGLADRQEFFKENALILLTDQDLKSVPQFNLENLDDVGNPGWDRNLRAYWQGLGTAWPETTVENGAAYRIAGIRSLSRFALRELGGDALGSFDDILLTLALGNPLQAPVPAPAVDASDGDDADRANLEARTLAASFPILDAVVGYALIGHSGWWGFGVKTSPVPISMLMMDRNYDERTMYVEADTNLIEDAPAIDAKQTSDLNDENFFTRARAYWQEAGFGPF